jgi:hypothetical protein
MENVRRKPFTQKEVIRVSNVVLEVIDNDSDNIKFYTPTRSPSNSIFEEIESHIQADRGVRHSKILLVAHENIMHKTLNAKISSFYQPSYLFMRFIKCSLTNEIMQISTSQSRVGVLQP